MENTGQIKLKTGDVMTIGEMKEAFTSAYVFFRSVLLKSAKSGEDLSYFWKSCKDNRPEDIKGSMLLFAEKTGIIRNGKFDPNARVVCISCLTGDIKNPIADSILA